MNRATRSTVSTIGVMLAIAGIDHGFFEILQGNTPTNGLVIKAIGDRHQMWQYGTEEAFSIIPNFLATGLLAIAVSVAIIVWSIRYVHTKHGATVLGLLFVSLFLVGGGIAAQIMFAPVTWAAARSINRPLTWWGRVLSPGIRTGLARIWPATLVLGCISFLIGLSIAITGYVPGLSDAERTLTVCWSLIFGGGLGLYLVSFVAGFASDIDQKVERTA